MSRLQLNFNGGEIDPDEHERVDLDIYNAGLALAENVIARPHGGISFRGGLSVFAEILAPHIPHNLDQDMVTLPNGGSAADLVAGRPFNTATAVVSGGQYVVAQIDFGETRDVSAFDLTDYYYDAGEGNQGADLPPGGEYVVSGEVTGGWPFGQSYDPSSVVLEDNHIKVQYFDGQWFDFGLPCDLSVAGRTRRIVHHSDVRARRFRIVSRLNADGGGVAMSSLEVCGRTVGGIGRVKHIPFSYNSRQYYSLWVTAGNIDVYFEGLRLASIAIPHSENQIDDLKYTQSLDTLLLFHEDQPVWRIFRQGAHGEWDSRVLGLSNIPLYDYTGMAINGKNSKQQIDFTDYEKGDKFNITLAGETTAAITYDLALTGLFTTTVFEAGLVMLNNVQAALGALNNVDSEGLIVSTDEDGDATITIEFTGLNGNREWPEMFVTTVSSELGGAVASTLERGEPGGEDVISAARGYPRCGAFFQQSLYVMGLKSRPSTFLRSVVGDYFNLDTSLTTPDVGLDLTLDGDDVLEIQHCITGRNLAIFTASSEHYIPNDDLSREGIRELQTTAIGTRNTIRPIVVDGPVIFIERRSGALRSFVFSEAEQSYVADVLSIHASHLLPEPIDMARRPARTAKEADLIVIPNSGGGPAAMLTYLRAHDIAAFTRLTTPNGEIEAVGVEDKERVELAVRRGERVFLEHIDDDRYLDNSVIFSALDQSVFNVPHIAVDEVCVMLDGHFYGHRKNDNGVVVLPHNVTGEVEIGLPPKVSFRTLPVRRTDERGGFSKDRYRIVRADFNFLSSPAFKVVVNAGREYFYEPQTAQNNISGPLPYFEGGFTAEGFPGSSVRPDLYFELSVPGPFHLRSLDMETSQ